MRVDVYKNLHKDMWSIRCRRTGKVVAHSKELHLSYAEFVVQPSGRERVLRELQKNVHAFVRGTWVQPRLFGELANPQQVVYNPYKSDKFQNKESGEVVTDAMRVFFNEKGVWIDG